MDSLTRRVATGLLAAAASIVVVGVLPTAASTAQPAPEEVPTILCSSLSADDEGGVQGRGCNVEGIDDLDDTFYLQGPRRTFLCESGREIDSGFVQAFDCRQVA